LAIIGYLYLSDAANTAVDNVQRMVYRLDPLMNCPYESFKEGMSDLQKAFYFVMAI